MELDYCKLVGYKPLALSGVNEIIYTPESAYQLILGTNGCGKSSFLSQLSMLPAVPGDYHEGGSKHWEGSHDGKRYILISTVGKKTARHSFVVIGDDGQKEELNPGGTGAVQKELVYQHTKLTTELHEVLLGRVRFVDMSPGKRREWLQYLCPVDVDAAIKMHQTFSTSARDRLTVHKHSTEQLINESKNVMSKEAYHSLEHTISVLKNSLTEYMEAKIPTNASYLPPNHDKLTELAQNILRAKVSDEFGSLSEIRTEAVRQQTLLSGYQDRYQAYLTEFYALDKQLQELGVISDIDLDAQKSRLELLRDGLTTLGQVQGMVPDSTATLASGILSDRIQTICEVLLSMPSMKEAYTRDNYIRLMECIKTDTLELETITQRRNHLGMELRRMEFTDSVICPSCATQFKPGVDTSQSDSMNKELELLIGQATLTKARITANIELKEEITQWRLLRQQMEQLLQGDAIQPFRDAIINSTYYDKSPNQLIPLVKGFIPTLSEQIEKFKLETEYATVAVGYQLAVAATNSARQANLQSLNTKYSELETVLADWLAKVEGCRKRLKLLNEEEKVHANLERWGVELKDGFGQAMHREVTHAQMSFNQRMDELIRDAHSRLALLEAQRLTAQTAQSNVDRLKSTLDILLLESKAFTELASTLSPKDGLIAEQLIGSINAIIEQMNEIISQVWTYDLEILPCGLESGELDYKFPLRIRGEDDSVVSDINVGSDSQKEIVNFAFRLIISLYLDLTEYPLYLDELGREFDESHAPRVMYYVKMLVESKKVTQVFLISHNPTLHSMFTLADINILHKDNVTVSALHNKCLEIH